jgi:hypothetical protein
MGSPLSSTVTEICLQYYEEMYIKHWLETQEIIVYRRYVDDIIIVFDDIKIDGCTISNFLKRITYVWNSHPA